MDRSSRYGQRYTLRRELGAGRLGEVHEALHGVDGIERVVAYKRLMALQGPEAELARDVFWQDTRRAAMLAHPGVVRVLDAGEEPDGCPYLVMDRVVGCDLRGLGEAATQAALPIPLDVALAIVTQLLEGLRHAHRLLDPAGQRAPLVHRGVSPTNVLVSIDGVACLTDFATSRAEEKLLVGLGEEAQPNKLAYMAPEVLIGDAVDARADVYSAGVLLYELTLGQRLLRGLDLATIRRSLSQPIAPPTFIRGGYPADLELIVMRALERYPEDRQPSAEVMLDELERFIGDAGSRASRLRLARFVADVVGLPRMLAADLSREEDSLRHEEALLGALADELDFDDPAEDLFDAPARGEEGIAPFDEAGEGEPPTAEQPALQPIVTPHSAVAEGDLDGDLEDLDEEDAPTALLLRETEPADGGDERGDPTGQRDNVDQDARPTKRLSTAELAGWTPPSERATSAHPLVARAEPEGTQVVSDDQVEEEHDLDASQVDASSAGDILDEPQGFLAQLRARSANRRSGRAELEVVGEKDALEEDAFEEDLIEEASVPALEVRPPAREEDPPARADKASNGRIEPSKGESADRLELTDGQPAGPDRLELADLADGISASTFELLAPDDPLTRLETSVEELDDEAADDEAADDEAADDEPADDEAADDEPADDEPADDEAADDEAADDEAADDEPADDEAADDEAADDEAADDEAADDEAADDEAADDEPADDEAADDEAADDEPADDEPADDEPADDEPADDEPADDEGLDDGTLELDGDDLEEVSRPEVYLSQPSVDRIDSGEVAAVLEGLAELSSAAARERDGGLAAMLDGLPKKENTLEIEEDDLLLAEELDQDVAAGDADDIASAPASAGQRPRKGPPPPPPPPSAARLRDADD